jgi:hypothetical protein
LKLDSTGAYQWHTFHGSVDDDYGIALALDDSAGIHVTGRSSASWGAPLNAHGGDYDIVVLKLNGSGAYQWHTFHGSSSADEGFGIATDASGNLYITGRSYATWGAPLNNHSGDSDIVVLKLDSNGAYQWHTFYGSDASDAGFGVAVDHGSGSVYVTGESESDWGEPLHTHDGFHDTFVLKLNTNGAYQWHTFYGSGAADAGLGIAVDGSGNVYVTGYRHDNWVDVCSDFGNLDDIFVLKLDANGVFRWAAFHGSEEVDSGNGIAADGSGNVYVTGAGLNTWGAPLNAHSGNWDIFVLKLDGADNLYTISGKVTANGAPLPDVTINLSCADEASTTTGADGGYAFAGLANGYYCIEPTLDPYKFTPEERELEVNGADVGNQDFTGKQQIPRPTVTIKAPDPKASEPGRDKGRLVITRTGGTSAALTVYYKVEGTAKNGFDYRKLSGTITIPIGKASARVIVKPLDNRIKERKETVKVTLIRKTYYLVGNPSGAMVTISDND